MNSKEVRATTTLSLVYALRMLGMFMILPVFAIYARDLPHPATPLQIGLAIGCYGLVQAMLQIPFGMLSDRIGRKPVIVLGLTLFAAGSFLAGSTHDIRWIIAGRALQGAGAISSAASALLADVTRAEFRTQAMAILGAGMGVSFIVALILGPVVSGLVGVSGIFTLTGILALLAIPLVLGGVASAPRPGAGADDARLRSISNVGAALADRQLLRLDGGIFLLHAMMTTVFIAAPLAIEQTLGLPSSEHWRLYLPVLLVSVIPVFTLSRRIEAGGHAKAVFIGSVVMLGAALLLASGEYGHADSLIAALLLFFVAFNYLEGLLPSMISRRAPATQKGAALGVYSSSQFLGGFAGGSLGGLALGHWGIGGVFAVAAALSLLWLSFAIGVVPVTRDHRRHEDRETAPV